MRVCWNWQTGTFEVRVLYDIRVQVPSPAPIKKTVQWAVFFICKKDVIAAKCGSNKKYLIF